MTTPIKHLIVIFQENRTFDHYFGTYPYAENPPREPNFHPRKGTPSVNGLSHSLKTNNQNLSQPFRLTRKQGKSDLGDPNHDYIALQKDINSGLMDAFVQNSGQTLPVPSDVMGYFDGNTVTALWNYAQHFAMSDNFHQTTIGQSTTGALNLVAGQTHGAIPNSLFNGTLPIIVDGTIINDIDPVYDKCSSVPVAEMIGVNIGHLLNHKNITWGWFQGGFRDCHASHIGPNGKPVVDYVAHHNPFQYYKSTSNPNHLPPLSPKTIGHTDQANHLYDLIDFWEAANIGNLPSVSFLKSRAFENGHPGNSSPLLEQRFIVETINKLQNLPQWQSGSLAIILTYDCPGGWYDHEMVPIINDSQIPYDSISAPGHVGTNTPLGNMQGRPAYGMRSPLLLISPRAKKNYVDSKLIDETSIIRFIEDNWNLGRLGNSSFDAIAGSIMNMFDFDRCPNTEKIILDPITGLVR